MKRIITSFATLALVIGIAVPVAAQGTTVDRAALREQAKARAQEQQKSRQAKVAEIKEEVDARKIELQQQRCKRFEIRLKSKIPRLRVSAKRVKSNIDKIYERLLGFYETGQLTVSDYEKQVLTIETAKANAEAALDALDEFSVEVNCDDQQIGTQLDRYRTAVKDARDEIKAYRKTVVDLIKSMRAAAAEQNTQSTEQTGEGTTNAQ